MVFLLYITDVLSQLQPFLAIVAGLLAFCVMCCLETGERLPFGTPKIFFTLSFVLALCACLIPSKKTMYLMAAVSVVKDVLADPKVAALNDRVFVIINEKLDELEGKKK